jgi:hypothetical protein
MTFQPTTAFITPYYPPHLTANFKGGYKACPYGNFVVAGFIPTSGVGDGLGGYKTHPYDPGTRLHQLNGAYFLDNIKC